MAETTREKFRIVTDGLWFKIEKRSWFFGVWVNAEAISPQWGGCLTYHSLAEAQYALARCKAQGKPWTPVRITE